MFERATAVSAILIFIVFGIIGSKCFDYLKANSEGRLNPVTTTQ